MIADISQLINAIVKPGPYDIPEPRQLFLPRLSESAPVLIDSVSINLTGVLVLKRLVDRLNQSTLPRRFLLGRSAETRRRLGGLVAERRLRPMHRIERKSRRCAGLATSASRPSGLCGRLVPHVRPNRRAGPARGRCLLPA